MPLWPSLRNLYDFCAILAACHGRKANNQHSQISTLHQQEFNTRGGALREDVILPYSLSTYFLGRETIIAAKQPGMAVWREKLFSVIAHNATSATAYFCLPPDRVVEMGEQIEI